MTLLLTTRVERYSMPMGVVFIKKCDVKGGGGGVKKLMS